MGRGLYECDSDSRFDTIVRVVEIGQELMRCDEFRTRRQDEMVYGLTKGRYVPLNTNGYYALSDTHGMTCWLGLAFGGYFEHVQYFRLPYYLIYS